jgi:hypothetical protein
MVFRRAISALVFKSTNHLSRDSNLHFPGADHRQKATLHQGQLFALYNHPSGFFARLEGYWARQSNVGYSPDIPGTTFSNAMLTLVTVSGEIMAR